MQRVKFCSSWLFDCGSLVCLRCDNPMWTGNSDSFILWFSHENISMVVGDGGSIKPWSTKQPFFWWRLAERLAGSLCGYSIFRKLQNAAFFTRMISSSVDYYEKSTDQRNPARHHMITVGPTATSVALVLQACASSTCFIAHHLTTDVIKILWTLNCPSFLL